MMSITAIAPISAANVIESVPAMPAAAPPMMARATPRDAPLEMPKIEGPASGLRKSVCMSQPLSASAMPPVSAVIALGKRDSKMITLIFSSDCTPTKLFTTSIVAMLTDPRSISRINSETVTPNSVALITIFFFPKIKYCFT